MLNWYARYWPVVEFIKAKNPKNILEIGSGSWGLAAFIPRKVFVCDLVFPRAPLPNAVAISTSCFTLPFPSDVFELVVSLDMLEHISKESREEAIQEMLRVSSKYLIIGCPNGKKAYECDFRLFKCYQRNKLNAPSWLIEHIHTQFPKEEDICHILDKLGVTYNIRDNEKVITHYLIMRGEMNSCINRIFKILLHYPNLTKYILSFVNFGKIYRKMFYITK